MDAHCFELENGPFEAICFPSPISSAMPSCSFSVGSPLALFPSSSPPLPVSSKGIPYWNGCSRLTHVTWISWSGFLWEQWSGFLVLVIQTFIFSPSFKGGKVLKIQTFLFVWNQSDLGGRNLFWKCLYFCQVVSMSLLPQQSTLKALLQQALRFSWPGWV